MKICFILLILSKLVTNLPIKNENKNETSDVFYVEFVFDDKTLIDKIKGLKLNSNLNETVKLIEVMNQTVNKTNNEPALTSDIEDVDKLVDKSSNELNMNTTINSLEENKEVNEEKYNATNNNNLIYYYKLDDNTSYQDFQPDDNHDILDFNKDPEDFNNFNHYNNYNHDSSSEKWDEMKENWDDHKEKWNDHKEKWNDHKEKWNDHKEKWDHIKEKWDHVKEKWDHVAEKYNDFNKGYVVNIDSSNHNDYKFFDNKFNDDSERLYNEEDPNDFNRHYLDNDNAMNIHHEYNHDNFDENLGYLKSNPEKYYHYGHKDKDYTFSNFNDNFHQIFNPNQFKRSQPAKLQ